MRWSHVRRTPTPVGRRSDEGGYVLALGAVVMTALMVFAALVVDVGVVYAERRRDQSAADSAALAAAQEALNPTSAATKAIEYAELTLGTDLPDAAWNSCAADPGRMARPVTGFNCISFNNARNRIRVRIPDRYYETSFARVIGVKKMRHSAFAIAGLAQGGFGGVLPFGMPAGAGGADGYACIKSNSGGQSDAPCNGPDSGNFGTIDITFFGSESHGTTQSCGSGDARTLRIPNNIAVGSDHQLGVFSGTELVDATACSSLTPAPNAAQTETGNLSNAVESGMLAGSLFSDGGPARLQRTDENLFGGNGRMREVRGNMVDDNGLWSFISPSLTSGSAAGGNVPRSCQRNQFVDSSGSPTMANLPANIRTHVEDLALGDRMLALLTRCFAHYTGQAWGGGATAGLPALVPPEPRVGCGAMPLPCTDPVFGFNTTTGDSPNLFDIQYTPRFAYVPEIIGSFPSGSSQPVRFRAFKPVFIQRLTLGSGGNARSFDPGISSSSLNVSGNGVREVTLWVFPDGMLPAVLGQDGAAYAIGVNRFVQLAG